MLGTLIQKEIALHLLSIRFVALLLMCVLLIPLNFHVNYRNYLKRQVDYQEAIKNENSENLSENPAEDDSWKWRTINPNLEVSKLIFQPTPLGVFSTGLEPALPNYLGMTRNGIKQGGATLSNAPVAALFGHLDFVFVVSTVFSLLALLFTFDAVAGEREAGTVRITLANPLPRDVFLSSKLLGGYVVFIVPFLLSVMIGLLVLVGQGFPLGEPDIFPRVLCLILASLLYIAVFFAMGGVISIYFDSSKTALIVAFTVWVFAVLILPRAGFLTAQVIAPAPTAESIYGEKAAKRAELRAALDEERNKITMEVLQEEGFGKVGTFVIHGALAEKINEKVAPFEEAARLEYRALAAELDRQYQRETKRQEDIGMSFSRCSPTASFIYLATGFTQTGQVKRDTYFQTGTHYYEVLDAEMFSKMSEGSLIETGKIPAPLPPPSVAASALTETLQRTLLDVLLLCFFAIGLTTAAFVKFFRTEI
jgi:ABC-type transport system involved in multi-copper enzyme maturation permease subunit